jgi:hypothetical protein
MCCGGFFFLLFFFGFGNAFDKLIKDRRALNRSSHVLDSLLARSIRCWQVVKINCVSTYVYPNWQKSFSFSFLLKKKTGQVYFSLNFMFLLKKNSNEIIYTRF